VFFSGREEQQQPFVGDHYT